MLAMLTMTPWPFLSMCGRMACMPYNVPFTLRSKVFSKSASSISKNVARRIAAPAELNKNCTLPNASIARLAMSLTCLRTVTSTFSASDWLPLSLTCAAVSRAVLIDVGAHHVCMFAREDERGCAADTTRGAGDDDSLSNEIVERLWHGTSLKYAPVGYGHD